MSRDVNAMKHLYRVWLARLERLIKERDDLQARTGVDLEAFARVEEVERMVVEFRGAFPEYRDLHRNHVEQTFDIPSEVERIILCWEGGAAGTCGWVSCKDGPRTVWGNFLEPREAERAAARLGFRIVPGTTQMQRGKAA